MHHAATMLTYASPAHRGRAIVTFTCSALTGGLQPRVLLIDDVDATMTAHHLGAGLVLQKSQRVPDLHNLLHP